MHVLYIRLISDKGYEERSLLFEILQVGGQPTLACHFAQAYVAELIVHREKQVLASLYQKVTLGLIAFHLLVLIPGKQ